MRVLFSPPYVEAPLERAQKAPVAEGRPANVSRNRRKKAEPVAEEAAPVEAVPEAPVAEDAPAKPKRTRRKKAEPVAEEAVAVEAAPEAPVEAVAPAETAEAVTVNSAAEGGGENDDGTQIGRAHV